MYFFILDVVPLHFYIFSVNRSFLVFRLAFSFLSNIFTKSKGVPL